MRHGAPSASRRALPRPGAWFGRSSGRPTRCSIGPRQVRSRIDATMRFVFRALLPAAAALALAVPAAVPAPAKQTRHTQGFIEALAADGPLVAYDAQGD